MPTEKKLPTEEGSGKEETKPMTKPQEVQESNDEKIDQDFPGYPHYPAKEDILDPRNKVERVDLDLENMNRSLGETAAIPNKATNTQPAVDELQKMEDDDLEIIQGTDADVTAEDLRLLEAENGEVIKVDDDMNLSGFESGDINGGDLDIPGSELDDENEAIGEEDEENNYYSLGADKEDALENDLS